MEILRASGSMPFVSKPVTVNHNKYLDGGIADSIPIDKIMSMDFDRIIVVQTRVESYKKKKSNQLFSKIYYRKYPEFVKTMSHRYLEYNKEVEKILELERQGKIIAIRPSKLIKIKRTEKNIDKIQEMYDLGRKDALEMLDKIENFIK